VQHVACRPAAVSSVEFLVPENAGCVPAFYRLDCFNGVRGSGIGEILEIVKIEA
jgi:hypothetical protein